MRFSQECVFTPVSAQTQAFVPAHTVWRGQNPPPNTQLYGAYGQPLPANNRDQYAGQPQQQQQQQQGQQQQPGQYPPPPQGYQQQQMYPQQQGGTAGSKRPNEEPHTPTLPPPNPGQQNQMQQGQYGYSDPSGMNSAGASPASSFNTSYYPAQYFPQHLYTQPQSPYSYEASRASSSPQSVNNLQPGTSVQWGPAPSSASHTQPQGAKVKDVAGQSKQEERTTADTSMLSAFNRGPK